MAQVLPFNGFYTGNSAKNSARTCVNFMPVRHDAGALSEFTLQSTVGINASIDTQNFIALGLPISWRFDGDTEKAFFVSFIESNLSWGIAYSDGTTLVNYPIGTRSGGVFLECLFSALSNQFVYVITASGVSNTSSIRSINSSKTVFGSTQLPNQEIVGDLANLGDRFLYSVKDEDGASRNYVYYSDIGDPTTVGALSFFSDTSQTTETVGIHTLKERLYLFSKKSYSVWSLTSDVNLPYQKQTGSTGSIGLLSQPAKTEVAGVIYFIGLDNGKPSLYSISGGRHQYLGNEYIDDLISEEVTLNLFSFIDGATQFICINKKEDNFKTLLYDIKTGEFHVRQTKNSSGNLVSWSVFSSIAISDGTSNTNVVFSSISESTSTINENIEIATDNKEIGTEFGRNVIRECVTSPFNSDGVTNNVRELAFQTDIDYSTAAPSPAVAPQLGLSVSKTFAKTFETERLEDFDIGTENTKILRFLNIGFFRQAFVFKIKTENIYPHKILKMLVRLQKGFRQI
jgi:hypothetical protein